MYILMYDDIFFLLCYIYRMKQRFICLYNGEKIENKVIIILGDEGLDDNN